RIRACLLAGMYISTALKALAACLFLKLLRFHTSLSTKYLLPGRMGRNVCTIFLEHSQLTSPVSLGIMVRANPLCSISSWVSIYLPLAILKPRAGLATCHRIWD